VSDRTKSILIGSGLALCVGVAAYFGLRKPDPCDTDRVKITVTDEAMRPFLKQGDPLKVEQNYYACNAISRGDWVAYSLGGGLKPMVRIAVGIPGDEYELIESKEDQRWNIKINGELYQTDWGAGMRPYFFGTTKVRPVLVDSNPKSALTGRLGEGEVLLLAQVPPGFMDAGVTGKRLLRESYGKAEKPESFSENQKKEEEKK
jgi:hypothetical protein